MTDTETLADGYSILQQKVREFESNTDLTLKALLKKLQYDKDIDWNQGSF